MYACIDLGSNSFHLLIGEMENGKIKILERCSDKVQLGEGVRTSGEISPQAFKRGIDCLSNFRELMAEYLIEHYWALGTNAFRVTSNAPNFIKAAREIGIDISVISGVQEAVLIYAGVITELPENSSKRLIIDIGGGSTEVIAGSGQTRFITESMPIGSVAWRDRFFSKESKNSLDQQLTDGLEHAKEVFSRNAPAVRKIGWDEAYASSGTVKMITSISTNAGCEPGYIELDSLLAQRQAFIDCIANDTELAGLKERRRDLLLAGWCIIVGLMQSYGLERIKFSPTALREGMLDFIVKNEKTIETMENSDLPQLSASK